MERNFRTFLKMNADIFLRYLHVSYVALVTELSVQCIGKITSMFTQVFLQSVSFKSVMIINCYPDPMADISALVLYRVIHNDSFGW